MSSTRRPSRRSARNWPGLSHGRSKDGPRRAHHIRVREAELDDPVTPMVIEKQITESDAQERHVHCFWNAHD
jgi:hypothetical protein